MRSRSLKLQRAMRVYVPLARKFLHDNPTCQFPLGCTQPSTVIHHTRGRAGRRLTDTTWWAASCHAHNAYAEEQTGHSLEIGWLHQIEGAS